MKERDELSGVEAARVQNAARLIDSWNARVQAGEDRAVESGSSLAGDDAAATPFHVSHASWQAINRATDMLALFRNDFLRGQVPDEEVHARPYGAPPVIRAALENASAAVWLLHPPSRNERVRRRLRWHASNLKHQDEFLVEVGEEPSKAAERQRETITAIALERGLGSIHGVGTRTVVREAGEALGRNRAQAIWQVLSGASHGDFWTTMVLNTDASLKPIEDTSTDLIELKVTLPARTQIGLARVAVDTLRSAYDLYDQRRVRVF